MIKGEVVNNTEAQMRTFKLLDSERILPDYYPVYYGYCYIVDNKCYISDIEGTVADIKRKEKAKEVRRYQMFDKSREGARVGDLVIEGGTNE
jgi:hypothetical protein